MRNSSRSIMGHQSKKLLEEATLAKKLKQLWICPVVEYLTLLRDNSQMMVK